MKQVVYILLAIIIAACSTEPESERRITKAKYFSEIYDQEDYRRRCGQGSFNLIEHIGQIWKFPIGSTLKGHDRFSTRYLDISIPEKTFFANFSKRINSLGVWEESTPISELIQLSPNHNNAIHFSTTQMAESVVYVFGMETEKGLLRLYSTDKSDGLILLDDESFRAQCSKYLN